MNDEIINDFKQFVTATVSQQTSDIHDDIEKLDTKLGDLDIKLSKKIDDLSASVAEALDSTSDATDTQLKDHERRIGLLEQKAA